MKIVVKRFDKLDVNELYEILKLRAEIFIVEQNCAYQDLDLKDKKSYHLYIEEKGEVVAYIRIIDRGVSYNEISIGRVVVKKEFRGRGLGRKVVQAGIDFAESTLKEREIKISAQAHLVKFYESLGFKQVSEVYLEDKIPHVKMIMN